MSKFRTVVAVIIMILCGVAGLFLGERYSDARDVCSFRV